MTYKQQSEETFCNRI